MRTNLLSIKKFRKISESYFNIFKSTNLGDLLSIMKEAKLKIAKE
jgi:hypothetical protein